MKGLQWRRLFWKLGPSLQWPSPPLSQGRILGIILGASSLPPLPPPNLSPPPVAMDFYLPNNSDIHSLLPKSTTPSLPRGWPAPCPFPYTVVSVIFSKYIMYFWVHLVGFFLLFHAHCYWGCMGLTQE